MQGSAEQKAPAALNLRFTTLYTFPPLYTQKARCQAGFVFVGDFSLKKQWQTMYSTHRAAAFGCDPAVKCKPGKSADFPGLFYLKILFC